MAVSDDLTLKLKAIGARQAARDVDKTSRSVGRMGKQARTTHRSLLSLRTGFKVLAGGAVAAGSAVGGMSLILGKQAVTQFRESEKVGNQTNAVLKSMGATSWTSAKQIGALANSLSVKAGVDDEAIQTGANLLLTFGKVRNEVGKGNDIFNRATAAAVDLSAAGFGSLNSTSKQLGKALNDPVKGITALNRSGVQFTKKQKDTIKSLVAHNHTLEAQKIIMREVERQVKGSAAAQADPIDKLKVAWENLLEVAGKPIWGVMTKAIDRLIGPLQHVSSTAAAVFDDKNLNWQQKFQAIGRSIRHWFGPIADDMIAALKNAHLDQKLKDLIVWASPQISAGFKVAAPAAARAFIAGFKAAPAWAKVLTAGFLIAKTRGIWGALAGSACRQFSPSFMDCVGGKMAGGKGGGLAGKIGSALKTGMPALGTTLGTLAGVAFAGAWVAAVGIPAYLAYKYFTRPDPKVAEATRAKAAVGNRARNPTTRTPTFDAQGFPTGKYQPGWQTANDAASAGYHGIPTPPVHVAVHVDGKVVAHATTRAATRKKATR